MRKLTLLTTSVIVALCVLSFAQLVMAEDNPWVATFDTNDDPKTQFMPGETVRIKAYSHSTPYYIYVYKPDASLAKTIGPINNDQYSGDHNDISTILGWWTIHCIDASTHMGVGQYEVIPVAPLGTLGILGACFAGLGIKSLRTKRRD